MAMTLREMAALVGGRALGDAASVVAGIAAPDEAAPGDIALIADAKRLRDIASCKATAIILKEGAVKDGDVPAGKNVIFVKNPHLALARAIGALRPSTPPSPGIHPAAVVHRTARVGKDACVQACAVIEARAVIGERCVIYPGVYIGEDASIGDDTVLYPGVVVRERCTVGQRVIIHANAVIGADGFGYARDGAAYRKIPQAGTVRVCDDVEIGACTTVDRATLGETVIGRGTKIDNLVMIAHNVKIGEDTVLAAQTGIAGSTEVGSRVQFGGQAGLTGHIEVADDVMIGAKAGVTNNISKSGVYSGFPAIPHTEWLRAQAVISRLPELQKRIIALEKRLSELEEAD